MKERCVPPFPRPPPIESVRTAAARGRDWGLKTGWFFTLAAGGGEVSRRRGGDGHGVHGWHGDAVVRFHLHLRLAVLRLVLGAVVDAAAVDVQALYLPEPVCAAATEAAVVYLDRDRPCLSVPADKFLTEFDYVVGRFHKVLPVAPLVDVHLFIDFIANDSVVIAKPGNVAADV